MSGPLLLLPLVQPAACMPLRPSVSLHASPPHPALWLHASSWGAEQLWEVAYRCIERDVRCVHSLVNEAVTCRHVCACMQQALPHAPTFQLLSSLSRLGKWHQRCAELCMQGQISVLSSVVQIMASWPIITTQPLINIQHTRKQAHSLHNVAHVMRKCDDEWGETNMH